MNAIAKGGTWWGLGLKHLAPRDRSSTWKPLLFSFLAVGGSLAIFMTAIWWFTT